MTSGVDQKFVSEGERKLLPGWTESCFLSKRRSCFPGGPKVALRGVKMLLPG